MEKFREIAALDTQISRLKQEIELETIHLESLRS